MSDGHQHPTPAVSLRQSARTSFCGHLSIAASCRTNRLPGFRWPRIQRLTSGADTPNDSAIPTWVMPRFLASSCSFVRVAILVTYPMGNILSSGFQKKIARVRKRHTRLVMFPGISLDRSCQCGNIQV